jgi:hypothetical protein
METGGKGMGTDLERASRLLASLLRGGFAVTGVRKIQSRTRSRHQRIQIFMLGEHGRNSGADRGQFQFTRVVGGEEEERNAGQDVAESGGSFQTVHFRHGEIENDEVGGELLGFLDGVDTVNGLAANGEVGMRSEKQTELAANHFVIVDEQD